MDVFEQKKVLGSMVIIHDRREQDTARARARYKAFGEAHVPGHLDYGDYTYNVTFSDGSMLYQDIEHIEPICMIERKMDLDELAACFCEKQLQKYKDLGVRNRFEWEFAKAKAHQARSILLIENGCMDDIYVHNYRSRMKPQAFMASLSAWIMRYDIQPVFCDERRSGEVIRELLYRDLKERLERGEFDERA